MKKGNFDKIRKEEKAYYNAVKATTKALDFINIDGGLEAIVNKKNCKVSNVIFPVAYKGQPVLRAGVSSSIDSSDIKKITIPSGILHVGDRAFKDCRNVTEVIISDTVTNIGRYAFYGCSSLVEIELTHNVNRIYEEAFSNCKCLKNISVYEDNENYKSIDGNLYNKDGTLLVQYAIGKTETSFVIPDEVSYISGGAFANCTNLAEITIPSGVNRIYDGAFRDSKSLTKVNYLGTFDEWIEKGFGSSFDHPYNLYINDELVADVEIKNVNEVIDEAFAFCSSLNEVKISHKVKSIGCKAFKGCSNLKSVKIGDNVTSIGAMAFEGCSNLTDVELGNKISVIPSGAFAECRSLKSITIPNKVNKIEENAFYNCDNLTEVIIGKGVKEIREKAFLSCNALTNAVFKAPKGWGCKAFSQDACGDHIFSNTLEDPVKSATYLRSEYAHYKWEKVYSAL